MARTTTIEDHFRAIEEAVAALEEGELPLEEALARYEAGLKAVRAAKTQLDRYSARLTELRADDAAPALSASVPVAPIPSVPSSTPVDPG